MFTYSTSGATISENCSYIRNPSFPSGYAQTNTLTYTVEKCSSGKLSTKIYALLQRLFLFRICLDVCDLRLDFESFTTLGPTNTQGDGTNDDCRDTFTIAASTLYPSEAKRAFFANRHIASQNFAQIAPRVHYNVHYVSFVQIHTTNVTAQHKVCFDRRLF